MTLKNKFFDIYKAYKKKEIFWFLITIICSLIISFLIQTIYIKITGVTGDQDYYMGFLGEEKRSQSWMFSRTGATYHIYKFLRTIFGTYFARYILPLITSITIFKLIYPYWKNIPFILFIVSLLLPHFWVWQTIASKEAIIILPTFLLAFYCAKTAYIKPNINVIGISLICFLIIAFYRIHYSISYFWILSSTIMVVPNLKLRLLKKLRIKNYLQIISLILVLLFIIFFIIFRHSTLNIIELIFEEGSNYFTWTESGKTTRWDVEYKSVSDIIKNLYWGIPSSIIGFTPSEVIENPKYIFSFLEGLIAFTLIPLINLQIIKKSKYDPRLRFLFFYTIIPSIALALMAHYPFGIFNPGSSIRFKQSISSVLYFYPIFLIMFSNNYYKSLNQKN